MKTQLWKIAVGFTLGILAMTLLAPYAGAQGTAMSPSTPTMVTVTLTNTGIMMTPSSVPSGRVSFTVINHGTAARTVRINKQSQTIAPGASGTFAFATLNPGSYTISSPAVSRTEKAVSSRLRVVNARTKAPRPVVTASITNMGITLNPPSIPAGSFALRVTNNDRVTHIFRLSGAGMKAHSVTLKPGQTKTISVTSVKPGAYQVADPKDKTGKLAATLSVTNAMVK